MLKYPRTLHLPWSENIFNDDKVIKTLDYFAGKHVTVTAKMDGENTTMSCNGVHARSLDSKNYEYRTWVKKLWSEISYRIPPLYRICGENMFAKHSIHYKNLEDLFLVFNIWRSNRCISWYATNRICKSIGIKTVPVLWHGIFDIKTIKKLSEIKSLNGDEIEGYVIRITDSFMLSDFSKCVAKYVRKNHVQTDKHWMQGKIIRNEVSS